MQRDEIYLASFPFGDVPGMKLRPVLLLTEPIGPNSEVLVAYISSVVPSALLPSDILLDLSEPEAQTTNLKVISVLRLHKLATIHATSVRRYLGKIAATVGDEVNAKLKVLLSL
ncbi:MAG: type II toxin-antitoxin system PemK/MazF family toxin [Deltaproteobacteria bacterium]|nr:type II toxin-antitoxin system PemK/MazF family toxin [Deltaproteobacteria bacterium]